MKREVSRDKKLPAFKLSMGELELLLNRLRNLFDSPDQVRLTIDIDLKSELLSFASFQEFRDCNELPANCTEFTIYLSHKARRISIRSRSLLRTGGQVVAMAENEAWCAGVVDTVSNFVKARKVWYWWLIAAPLGLLFVAYSSVSASFFLSQKSKPIELKYLIAWICIFLLLGLLTLVKDKSLPACSIRRTDEVGFLRNHMGELGLIIAALSAAISLAGLFIEK